MFLGSSSGAVVRRCSFDIVIDMPEPRKWTKPELRTIAILLLALAAQLVVPLLRLDGNEQPAHATQAEN